ncbi:homeodomain-only protein [Brachionichthys hirsutus]|uniref:homeodomain-only protein n=1 Tax=Brachionichthys hirsutus TaxID=412623 RepID=UPI0036043013
MAAEPRGPPSLSEEQLKVLEESFVKFGRHPSDVDLMLIAAECRLSEEETEKWFKQRNIQWRRDEGLPCQEGSVFD